MKTLILLLCLNVWCGQRDELQHRKDFLKNLFIELSNKQLDKDKVRKKFIHPIRGEKHDERIELINQILADLGKGIEANDLSSFDFVPYSELPKSEHPFQTSENENDVFIVKHNNQYFVGIQFDKDKIKSLIVMDETRQKAFSIF